MRLPTTLTPEIPSMAFVTLEDEHGIAESVWFPEVYHAHGSVINAGRPFQVTGKVVVELGVVEAGPLCPDARDGSTLEKPSIRPMAFVTLEDEYGIAESVWFPDIYHAYGAAIAAGQPFWITGKVMVEFGVATLEVTRVDRL